MIHADSLCIASVVTTDNDEYFDLTLKSLVVTLQSIRPAGTLLICPFPTLIRKKLIIGTYCKKYNITIIPSSFKGIDYSYYLLNKLKVVISYSGLHTSCSVSHVLVHQWDSCIIRPDLWTDEFLKYDYIGAPWPFFLNYAIPEGKNLLIGNGGFSIRSKHFLDYSNSLTNAGYVPKLSTDLADNEDILSCVKYQDLAELYIGRKLMFPSLDLARRFSIERQFPKGQHFHTYEDLSSYNSFGFHGKFNTAGMNYINTTWEAINNG